MHIAPWQSHEGPDPELARTPPAIDASPMATRLNVPDSSDGRQSAAQESMRTMIRELKETEAVVAKTAVSIVSFYVMRCIVHRSTVQLLQRIVILVREVSETKDTFRDSDGFFSCWFMCSLHCQRQSDGQDHGRCVM